jgi:ketosteroid isomerase-like protein
VTFAAPGWVQLKGSEIVSAIAAFVLGVALTPQAAAGVVEGDVAELVHLESVWNDSHLRGDADALDRLWADDLVVVVPKMAPLAKTEALGFLRSGRMKFSRYETSEVVVRRYGDTAVATGRLRRSREIGGRVLDDDWRFIKVYLRRAGAWRVVAFHASGAAPRLTARVPVWGWP